MITIVHWIKEAALSGEQLGLIVGFNIRLRIAITNTAILRIRFAIDNVDNLPTKARLSTNI